MLDNIGYRIYLDRETLCETAKSLQTLSGRKILILILKFKMISTRSINESLELIQ